MWEQQARRLRFLRGKQRKRVAHTSPFPCGKHWPPEVWSTKVIQKLPSIVFQNLPLSSRLLPGTNWTTTAASFSLSFSLSRRGCSSREKCAVCIRKGPLEYFTRDLEKSNAPNYLFPVVSRIASIPLPLFFQSVKHELIVVHANYFRYTRQTLLFRLVIRLKFSSFGGCMIFCVWKSLVKIKHTGRIFVSDFDC